MWNERGGSHFGILRTFNLIKFSLEKFSLFQFLRLKNHKIESFFKPPSLYLSIYVFYAHIHSTAHTPFMDGKWNENVDDISKVTPLGKWKKIVFCKYIRNEWSHIGNKIQFFTYFFCALISLTWKRRIWHKFFATIYNLFAMH